MREWSGNNSSSDSSSTSSRGLGYGGMSNANISHMRNRMKSREISERKQVGDAESMMNEPAINMPGSGSEWLD